MGGTKRPRSLEDALEDASTTPSKRVLRDTERLSTEDQGQDINITVKVWSKYKAMLYSPSLTETQEYRHTMAPPMEQQNELESDSRAQATPGEFSAIPSSISRQENRATMELRERESQSESEGEESETDVDSMEDDEDQWPDQASEYDESENWEWLEQINAEAREVGKEIGSCKAKLIRRREMNNAFWTKMEEPTEETSDLAFTLFDRYGRLNREYCEHAIKKGTGVWGKELDYGDILLFEQISVTNSSRRRRVATKIVNAVLKEARSMSEFFFAFAQPGYLGWLDAESEEERHRLMTAAVRIADSFWRSLGFRRVGSSPWLAFTDAENHRSRVLRASQDFDGPDIATEEEQPEFIQAAIKVLVDPTVTGSQCLKQIQELLPVDVESASITRADKMGDSILHTAAVNTKAEAVAYIISNWPELASIRNLEGYTAAEALGSAMELRRTQATASISGRTADISDKFIGFKQSELACLAALTNTTVFDLTKLADSDLDLLLSATDEQLNREAEGPVIRRTLRLKYGCTCGECLGGFLSPRMAFSLSQIADRMKDRLLDSIDSEGPDWVDDNGEALRFLEPLVRDNLKTNRSMRAGFVNMCSHIVRCVEEKRVPNEKNVLGTWQRTSREWPPVTRNYLQRGGTVMAVARMLFEQTMKRDEWAGDGYLLNILDLLRDEAEALPKCRNDHEFGFVSSMCGHKSVSCVPYFDLAGRELEDR